MEEPLEEAQPLEELDDATLVQRALRTPPDGRAYRQLIFRHEQEVYAIVFSSVKDARAAKELTKDVFSKGWEKLPTFRGDSEFSTWVITLAQNLCTDYHRTRKRERERTAMSLDTPVETAEGEFVYPELPTPTPSPLDNLIRAESQQAVQDALDTLDEETREWMELHYIQGKTYPEIEEMTGVSAETIKTRCRRAKEALGGQEADHHRESGPMRSVMCHTLRSLSMGFRR